MREFNADIEVPYIFYCSICGFESTEHDILLKHLEETHPEETQGQNLEYFIEEISREALRQPEPEEESSVEELSEEEPQGKGYSTEEQLETEELCKKVVANWKDLDETTKKQFLSVLMGMTSGSVKKFETNLSTLPLEQGYLLRKAKIISTGRCSECDIDAEKLGLTRFKIDEDYEALKVALILQHLSKEHSKVYEALAKSGVFDMIVGFPKVEDPNKKTVEIPSVVSGNPEQCAEKLSKRQLELEQLASEIASDKQKREELFRLWIKSKQKRE